MELLEIQKDHLLELVKRSGLNFMSCSNHARFGIVSISHQSIARLTKRRHVIDVDTEFEKGIKFTHEFIGEEGKLYTKKGGSVDRMPPP